MTAVLLAVYNDHEAARRVRVMLIRDGFPTDRGDLTASDDLGRAGLGARAFFIRASVSNISVAG
jgi:hypothetical protein